MLFSWARWCPFAAWRQKPGNHEADGEEETAADLRKLSVGATGIEPVTSAV